MTTTDDGTTFHCRHCGATGVYDSTNGFYLIEWYAALKLFDDLHRDCARLDRATSAVGATTT